VQEPVHTERHGADIRLENLTKLYGHTIAVRAVSLRIHAGEFITLLGPSGSGKTTTLMMIAGFVYPTQGQIYIDAQEVSKVPPQRRDLGMVFQNYALFPHMRVFQNISFPLEMRGLGKREIRKRVTRALEMVQLNGYEQRYPRELSGGQQQRIALARAVVYNPRVLLMDEPLGALDKKLREHMQIELKHIQQRLGITVIYVTHDQEEALVMSDRIAVMREGRIEQVGTPAELYEEPVNSFVADFIGESNFLRGTVEAIETNGMICVQDTQGLPFRVQTQGTVKAGQTILAAVRPEKLALVQKPVDGEANSWHGRITEIIYIGDSTKLKVAVGTEELTIKESNRFGMGVRRVGDAVQVVWEPKHTKLLKDEGIASRTGVQSV
jgi:spermidine/putrescine ABC transporter ATP-binding subunit